VSEPFLRLQGVSKHFDRIAAVNGVSLDLEKTRLLALVGPSGCGKTTLLRLIAGFTRPDDGSISLDGRTLVGPGAFVPADKRHIGMVFQDYALFPHLSVEANVAFGLRERGDRRARVEELLSLVGLGITNPVVATGAQSPAAEPLGRPVVPVTMTLGGQTINTAFTGLTPFAVGLFQITFQVPHEVPLNTPLNLVITQGGLTANVTTLTIAP